MVAKSGDGMTTRLAGRLQKTGMPAVGMVQKWVTALGGWGRRLTDDAPRLEASALGAIWLCQLDPRHPRFTS
jgi:hypothetical protein